MKYYGKTLSTTRPKNIEITKTKVFVAEDIKEILIENVREYEYTLIEYEKDEYIELISNKNTQLEKDIIATQLAICDVYEMIN